MLYFLCASACVGSVLHARVERVLLIIGLWEAGVSGGTLLFLSVLYLSWHSSFEENWIFLWILCLFTAAQGEERECAFTDQQQQWEVERMAGGEGRISPENTTVRCGKGSHCFGLWEKSPPGEVRLVKQGMRPETWSLGVGRDENGESCFYFSPQNPQFVSINRECAADRSGGSHREDAVIKY